MRRHAIALIIQPYRNALFPQDRLREAIKVFSSKLLDLTARYPNIRINLNLPAFMLSTIDTLMLTQLRDLQKRDCLEWLTSGYTEPFLSFSQLWLSGANIRTGLDTFEELLATRPVGYAPPFSNWEPSCIDTLRGCGLQYVVVSQSLVPPEARDYCGFWITEHGGSTIPVFPVHTIHHYTAPANIGNWIDEVAAKDPGDESLTKLVAIHYLVPLVHEEDIDPFQWLQSLAQVIDNLLVRYRIIRLQEFQSLSYPLGIQYLPSHVVFKRNEAHAVMHFANYLHTFDQIGIIQRKMMEITERLEQVKDTKEAAPLLRQLFLAQDINRYLPLKESGFPHIYDRLWTYAKMIDIETYLHQKDHIRGGQIRIADLLRNGTKSIVLSNAALKVCIDHKNGGQVFELDFRDRAVNLCAGFNPRSHIPPRILIAGKSCTSFVDHFLEESCQRSDFLNLVLARRDEFSLAEFNYTIKKTSAGAKAVLRRQCAVSIDGRNYPLAMQKVFGIEGETPALSFVYQLSNHSLTAYGFKFAVEFTFSLPGAPTGEASIHCGEQVHRNLISESFTLENTTKWIIHDEAAGMSVQFVLQKPLTVWGVPSHTLAQSGTNYQGTTLVLTTPVVLNENASWSLIGKIACRKTKKRGSVFDEI